MNDSKNLILAWLSAGSPLLAAASSETGVTILSAIVLPILFFAIGKTVDVLLQIYLSYRSVPTTDGDTNGSRSTPKPATDPDVRNAKISGPGSSSPDPSSSSPSVVRPNLAARKLATRKTRGRGERSDNR